MCQGSIRTRKNLRKVKVVVLLMALLLSASSAVLARHANPQPSTSIVEDLFDVSGAQISAAIHSPSQKAKFNQYSSFTGGLIDAIMTVQQNVKTGLQDRGYQNASLTWEPENEYTFLTTESSKVGKQSAIVYLFKMNADHNLAQNVQRATPEELRPLVHPSSFTEYDVYCVRTGSNVLIRGVAFADDRIGKPVVFEWIAGAVFRPNAAFKLSPVFYRRR